MTDVMMGFDNHKIGKSLDSVQLRMMAPAIYADTPTNPNLSNRYTHINTSMVIDDLAKMGWYPVEAKQIRKNKRSNGVRSFHMVAFQNPRIKIVQHRTNSEGDIIEDVEAFPRIILTNSHDGFNSFKFMVGLFRLVCSNGLVIATNEMANLSIRHIDYSYEALKDVIMKSMSIVEGTISKMNAMQNITLSDEDKRRIAVAALRIRKGDAIDSETEIKNEDEILEDILKPVRGEDERNDLWTVFNICQEKLIKGGYKSSGQKGKMRKQRAITSIKKEIDYNQQFWQVAENFINEKAA